MSLLERLTRDLRLDQESFAGTRRHLSAAAASLSMLGAPGGLAQGMQQGPEAVENPYVLAHTEGPVYRSIGRDIEIQIDDETIWEIPIQRDISETNLRRYTHGFFAAFEERGTPLEGYPGIVMAARTVGSVTVLRFSVEHTSPELQEAARRVIQEDPNEQVRLKATDSSLPIEVRPLPVSDYYIRCYDDMSPDKSVLATGFSRGVADQDRVSFTMAFPSELLKDFLDAAKRGDLRFEFSYRINGVSVVQGVRTDVGSINISQSLNNSFGSQQKAGTAPIFREDKADFLRQARIEIRTAIRSNDRQVAQLLISAADRALLSQVFAAEQALPINELVRRYPGVEAQLAEYLRPHLKQLQENLAREGVEVKLHHDAERDEAHGGGGFSFMGFGASGGASNVEQHLRQLQETTGVTFTKGEGETEYRPHTIAFSSLIQGVQSVDLSSESEITIQLPPTSGYKLSTPTPVSLTINAADKGFGEIIGVDETIQGLKREVTSLTEQAHALRDQNGELNTKLGERDQTIQQLTDKVNVIEPQLNARAAEVAQLREEISRLSNFKAKWDQLVSHLAFGGKHFGSQDERSRWKRDVAALVRSLTGVDEDRAKRYADVADRKNSHYTPPPEPRERIGRDP